jgi:hypothetical protein
MPGASSSTLAIGERANYYETCCAYQASAAATSSPPSWIALPWATERVSQGATRFLRVGMSVLLCVPLNDKHTLPVSVLFFPKGFDVLRFQPRSTEARSRSVGGIRRGPFVGFPHDEDLMASQDPGNSRSVNRVCGAELGGSGRPGSRIPRTASPTGTTTFGGPRDQGNDGNGPRGNFDV